MYCLYLRFNQIYRHCHLTEGLEPKLWPNREVFSLTFSLKLHFSTAYGYFIRWFIIKGCAIINFRLFGVLPSIGVKCH